MASKTQIFTKGSQQEGTPDVLKGFADVEQNADALASGREFLGLPTIIYASRLESIKFTKIGIKHRFLSSERIPS